MLEAKDIKKTYVQNSNSLQVLKGVDLKINEGDILTIIGPSGAGKSTLLHILGGLDRPTEGQVVLENEELYQLTDLELAKIRNEKVGFVFQFYHLFPEFTALENVITPGLIKAESIDRNELHKRGHDLLNEVGLAERASHKPSQLSGGEQQRVAIARALVNRPKVIFCDEPTGNLDSETGRDIIQVLMNLNAKNKQTLVFVTHDEAIAKLSHTTIRLRDGQLVK